MADNSIDDRAPLIFRTSYIPPKVDNRTQLQKRLAVGLILSAVALERFAFYSLAGNLVLFLASDTIRWSLLHSVGASLTFFGASYISALIFSWISDAKLGRAKTILVGFVLYIGGYVFVSLLSKKSIFETLCDGKPERNDEAGIYWKEKCSIQITSVLVVTAIGIGAVQANMAVFGAEQHREQKDTTQYFDKYYASVNIGALLAFFIMSYVQQNMSWLWGHVISTGLLVMTWILFLIGYPYYIHIKPYDSVITNFFPVLISAFRTRRKCRRREFHVVNERRSSNTLILLREEAGKPDDITHEINERPSSFIDYAKLANYGRFPDRVVDDIKALRPIMIVFLLLIPYWIIYFQTNTTFVMQAVHMTVPSFLKQRMPVAWLSLADQATIIVAIFILNTCVYKRLHAKNHRFSLRTRIVIGMIFATLSMCTTGIVEIMRQQECDKSVHINQTIGNTNYLAADMSVFYQFPQFLTIGLSEVFTSVASMEFAYLAAPQSAQSLVMSLRFTSAGLSSFLGYGYISLYKVLHSKFGIENKECKDKDHPELFYIYFFVLAGIQILFIFIFLLCDHKFHLLKVSSHRFNTRLFIGSHTGTSTS